MVLGAEEGVVVKRPAEPGLDERNSLRAEAQDWGSRGGSAARRGRQWAGKEAGDCARVKVRAEVSRRAVRCGVMNSISKRVDIFPECSVCGLSQ